ncbi:MAG: hypothetical protein CMA03_04740 [Euryarchaeota archaeon]|nr:hypothetical protein [Euryarchaeota archaeon]
MPIFINKEVKDKTKKFWFGLGVPIVIGFGWTFVVVGIIVNMPRNFEEYLVNNENIFVNLFLVIMMNLGHLVIWPILAWWLMSRANTIDDLYYKKGAWMSMKLYMAWIAIIVVYVIIILIFTGGRGM